MSPTTPERRTHDYRRCGTTNLYSALDTASGRVITQTTARHRSREFIKFLNLTDRETPGDLAVHIVLDNSSAHKTAKVRKWLLNHPRFEFHFTPTYASWMNLVERWSAELTTKQIRRGTHTSIKELKNSIQQWTDNRNRNPRPFKWHKTADQILNTPTGYLQRINNSGH